MPQKGLRRLPVPTGTRRLPAHLSLPGSPRAARCRVPSWAAPRPHDVRWPGASLPPDPVGKAPAASSRQSPAKLSGIPSPGGGPSQSAGARGCLPLVPGCFAKPELLPVAFSSQVPAAGSSATLRPGASLKELFLWHTVLLGPFPAGAVSAMLGAAQTPQGWFPRVSGSTARDERPFLAHCLPAPGGSWVPGCRQGSGSCHSPWKAGVPQPLQPAAFAGISASDGLRHCSGPRQIRGCCGGGCQGGIFRDPVGTWLQLG